MPKISELTVGTAPTGTELIPADQSGNTVSLTALQIAQSLLASPGASFDALAPTTTRGDIIFHNATTNTRLAAGTSGYALIAAGAGADPAWGGFLQSGTGAVTRTFTAKLKETISVTDFTGVDPTGATDSTVGIKAAIAATPANARLYFPYGTYLVSGSGTEIFLITTAISLCSDIGNGATITVAAAVPTTTDIFHFKPPNSGIVDNCVIEGFSLSAVSGNPGRHFFNFDATNSNINIRNLQFRHNTFQFAMGGGADLYMVSNNVTGGIYDADIYQNTFLGGGPSGSSTTSQGSIILSLVGDSIRIIDNEITGSGYGIYASLVAGAGQLLVWGNNISANGGVAIDACVAPILAFNEIEQQAVSTEGNGVVVDLNGGSINIDSAKIFGNQIQANAGISNPPLLRIATATSAYVDGNYFGGLGTGNQITITGAATSTVLGTGNRFAGGGTAISDSSATTVYVPKPLGTAASLVGNATGSKAAAVDIALGNLFAFITGPTLANAALVGDVTMPQNSNATTLANIPSAVPMAGSLLATNIAAPSTPAAGKTSIYVDSTTKRLSSKNDAGTVAVDVVPDTGASNNFLTAISTAGVISKAQPSAANLSDGTTGTGTVVLSASPTFTGTETFANGTSSAPPIHGATAATGLYFATTLAGLSSSGGGTFTFATNTATINGAANIGGTLNLLPVSGGGSSGVSGANFYNYGAQANNQNAFFSYNARGTVASPTACSSGDPLFLIGIAGHDGTNVAGTNGYDGGLAFSAAGTFTTTSHPTSAILYVTKSGTKVLAAAITANADTSVTIGAGLTVGAALNLKNYTVAGLPAATTGDTAFATNVRVSGEGAGVGTGGIVSYNGTAWKVAGTNVTAAA